MAPSHIAELFAGFSVMLLILEVSCQRICFQNCNGRNYIQLESSPSTSCSQDSYCAPVRRCRAYRDLPNWRYVGVTCRPGNGRYRRVCCPRKWNVQLPSSLWTTPNILRPETESTPMITPLQPRSNGPDSAVINNPPDSGNSAGCGRSLYQPHRLPLIIGGSDAEEGQFPWMAAIMKRGESGNYYAMCSGFLIDRRHVLSAAHCFNTSDVTDYQTRIGDIYYARAEIYPIVQITIPPGYRRGMFYDDIAILTLSKEVDLLNVNIICLPDETISRMNLTETGVTVAGWGVTSTRGGEMSDRLKYLSHMPVVSNKQCNRVFRRTLTRFRKTFPYGITSNFVCAGFGERGQDSCGGDSGGPLMKQNRNMWFVVGILSFGRRSCASGGPAGYTRITSHLDWIRQNTRN